MEEGIATAITETGGGLYLHWPPKASVFIYTLHGHICGDGTIGQHVNIQYMKASL